METLYSIVLSVEGTQSNKKSDLSIYCIKKLKQKKKNIKN